MADTENYRQREQLATEEGSWQSQKEVLTDGVFGIPAGGSQKELRAYAGAGRGKAVSHDTVHQLLGMREFGP